MNATKPKAKQRKLTNRSLLDDDRFFEDILRWRLNPDPRVRMYAYAIIDDTGQGDRTLKPAAYKGPPVDITTTLRDRGVWGDFFVIVRRGKQMLHSGRVLFTPSPQMKNFRGQLELFKCMYGW